MIRGIFDLSIRAEIYITPIFIRSAALKATRENAIYTFQSDDISFKGYVEFEL